MLQAGARSHLWCYEASENTKLTPTKVPTVAITINPPGSWHSPYSRAVSICACTPQALTSSKQVCWDKAQCHAARHVA